MADPRWLDWARRLRGIAQNGLTYARDPFDVERYRQVQRLAAEIAAAGTGEAMEGLEELFAAETGYLTPKVDVRGAIFRGESVLLVKERSDGRWALPGGWADVDVTPAEAIEREVREETGLEAAAVRLLAVYDKVRHHHPPSPERVYKLMFQCEVRSGSPSVGIETAEVAYFAVESLPQLSAGRNTPEQVRRLFQLYRDASLGTDFD